MSAYEKSCPKCGDVLNVDARKCACGWTQDKPRGDKGVAWNHVCRWQYGSLKCQNPVGLFLHGEASGLCVFHRANPKGPTAGQIAEESAIHDAESYNIAAARQVYGNGDNPTVKAIREQIAAKPNRKRGGTFNNLGEWMDLCRERGTQA